MMLYRRTFCMVLAWALFLPSVASAADSQWKAGAAAAVITPAEPLWMAGYGNRNKPAEGTHHDLQIRVLVIEDAAGHRGMILSSDTLGIPQSIYNNTCESLKAKFGLERSQIMLNSSHTHCGPVLRGALHDIYPLDDEQHRRILEYSTWLEEKIVETVGQAIEKLEPAVLDYGVGTCGFAVNRRNNIEGEVPKLRRQQALKGPIDHSVPVLSVRKPDGQLTAIVFGYACHNTTLSFYKWCGDYAGFAQYALERSHPGAVALFAIGCGADQNPLPRRELSQCERYGHMLAAAVEETLLGPMKSLQPTLKTELELVTLNLGDAPTRAELEKTAAGKVSYVQRWAARLLKQMNAGEPFFRTYPYPAQVWKVGDELLWITLGGEVVVDYSLGFKKQFGENTWVTGYCNDVMAYIPSLRVLEEDVPPRASSRWGYEGNSSMMVYGMPAHRWATDIEDLISSAINRLVKKVGGPAER